MGNMQLSPKAINILASIKAELLSKSSSENEDKSVIITLSRPKKEPKTTQRMRHARTKGEAYQRMCRRGDWASPRY